MNESTRQFYLFLAACSGNWRNTIHISSHAQSPGWLMAADRDGRPVLMPVERFRDLCGEEIDPTECRADMSEAAFGDIFAQYLLWRLPKAGPHPLADLEQLLTTN